MDNLRDCMCGVHKGMMARQEILKKEGTNAQINCSSIATAITKQH